MKKIDLRAHSAPARASRRRRLTGTLLAAGLISAFAPVQAQETFPNRVVKVIVPFPAGGTADVLPRIVAEKLSERWHQPVIVDNRPGAGGNIGADMVMRAPPDGYTLLASPPGPLVINGTLYRNLSFDPSRLVPVSVLASVPNVLDVRADLPVQDVRGLIALARKQPGRITFASQGTGSTSHLTASLFESMTGVKLLHVPYKGTAPALTDLIGGQVDLFFDNLSSSLPQQRSGKLRILAVAADHRSPALPDVPTVIEAGVPGFTAVTWFGVAAPPGTPQALVARISADIDQVLHDPDVVKRFAEQVAEPVGGTPSQTRAFFQEETARWRKVIVDSGMSAQ